MKYDQRIILKNGNEAWLRNADEADGNALIEIFDATHVETDYLLSYPDFLKHNFIVNKNEDSVK